MAGLEHQRVAVFAEILCVSVGWRELGTEHAGISVNSSVPAVSMGAQAAFARGGPARQNGWVQRKHISP